MEVVLNVLQIWEIKMPSGKVHSAMTLSTITGIIGCQFFSVTGGSIDLYILGCATGLLVMPDLDVDNGSIANNFIRKILPPVEWVWKILWFPYAKLIPHRHPISHFPVVSTFIRIGYLFCVINLFYLLWSLLFDTVSSWIWIWNWSFFLGLCHVDILHWAADNTIKGKEIFEEN